MAHTSIEESLRARLDEIDAALLPYRHLIEERQRVTGLLDFYASGGAKSGSSQPYGEARTRARSKVAQLMTRTVEVLRGDKDHQMPFLALYERMPTDVLGNARHAREHYRGMLQRSGEKYGIEYVNSDRVRLNNGVPGPRELSEATEMPGAAQ